MSTRNKKYHGFCLTVMDPVLWNSIDSSTIADYVYMVIGEETTLTGKLHYQVAVWFNRPQSWLAVTKMFPACHVEACKKRFFRAVFYCMKDEKFHQRGDLTAAIKLDIILHNESKASALHAERTIPNVSKESYISEDVYTSGSWLEAMFNYEHKDLLNEIGE
jgi:hypothetical protein